MVQTDTLKITNDILALIAEIDEFKGSWKALGRLAPEQLRSLKHVAGIGSIGSSTRIEGSKLSDKEVEALLSNLEIYKFATRDEQEVAGYADVMNLVFQNYEYIALTENYILQLHRDLMQYSEKDEWHKGSYKRSPNHVGAYGPDGKSLGIVFETASPFETPIRMRELVEWATEALEKKTLHPLLVTALFIVEFLAIHPFQDGNGRLSRILTSYLLLKAGYAYVPYSSMEAVVEQNKESYYLALRQTQGTIGSQQPDWQPWLLFFLRTMQKQKQNLEAKLETEHLLLSNMPNLSVQILELVKTRGRIKNSEIVSITNANRNTVKKHLEALVNDKLLQMNGKGKGAWYSLGM